MVDMKQSAKEAGDSPVAVSGGAPAYPYGLLVTLNDESLKKLGLSTPPAVGTKMRMTALVDVTSASANATQEGTEMRAELQITDMELSGGGDSPAAQLLFDKE